MKAASSAPAPCPDLEATGAKSCDWRMKRPQMALSSARTGRGDPQGNVSVSQRLGERRGRRLVDDQFIDLGKRAYLDQPLLLELGSIGDDETAAALAEDGRAELGFFQFVVHHAQPSMGRAGGNDGVVDAEAADELDGGDTEGRAVVAAQLAARHIDLVAVHRRQGTEQLRKSRRRASRNRHRRNERPGGRARIPRPFTRSCKRRSAKSPTSRHLWVPTWMVDRMARYRSSLLQMEGSLFLTDGGIETTLIFLEGLELPYFAAFDLLKKPKGRERLRAYYRQHAAIAQKHRLGFILESATWRASPDWAGKLGYPRECLEKINREAITLLQEVRQEFETPATPMVISGCLGPRGDGYDPGTAMTAEEAQAYHAFQTNVFAAAEVDMVTAITMTNVPEAIGIVRAASAAGLPVVISFTVETDGSLPTGEGLRQAVEAVDAATEGAPAYYMVNCAHPTHFEQILEGDWTRRIKGLRCNASRRSHAELDAAADLDAGDPLELGQQYLDLRRRLPQLNVLGGCCGTDHRHIEQIGLACAGEGTTV